MICKSLTVQRKKAGAAMGMSSAKILGSTDTLGSVGSKGTLGSIQ